MIRIIYGGGIELDYSGPLQPLIEEGDTSFTMAFMVSNSNLYVGDFIKNLDLFTIVNINYTM